MANICWIQNDIDEARKKYYLGKKEAEISGCTRNYWPILVNLVSFEIFCGNYYSAWELHKILYPYLEQIRIKLGSDKLSSEQREYYNAALSIHLKNLWTLYDNTSNRQVLVDMCNLLEKNICDRKEKIYQEGKIYDEICRLDLTNTIFHHNNLYLLKN